MKCTEQNLAYSVLFEAPIDSKRDMWPAVRNALKLFKQKKHAGFYLEVEELKRSGNYRVKVYRNVL